MRHGSLSICRRSLESLKPARSLGAFRPETCKVQGSYSMASSSVWEEKKALRKDTSRKLKQMEDEIMKQQSKLSVKIGLEGSQPKTARETADIYKVDVA